MLFFVSVAGNIAVLIFAIIRYYKNLLTLEGYLSFTLPVTPAQHIMVKVVTAVAFDIIALVTTIIGLCIAMSGNLLVEVWNLLIYVIKNIAEEFGAIHLVLYALEIILLLILASFSKFLLYYGFITIGQMANRKKLLLAFGAYGVYTFLSGAFSTILNIFGNLFFITQNSIGIRIIEFMNDYPRLSVHIILLFSILVLLISSLIWFGVSNLIIHKKLNLE